MHMAIPRIGIGMDSSITPLRHGGLSLVQTTDFFYPLVEDPYMQGNLVFDRFRINCLVIGVKIRLLVYQYSVENASKLSIQVHSISSEKFISH